MGGVRKVAAMCMFLEWTRKPLILTNKKNKKMELQKKGTLFTQNKKRKLDYFKKNSFYEFYVYELEKSEKDIIKYKMISEFSLIMNKGQFINYLQTEQFN